MKTQHISSGQEYYLNYRVAVFLSVDRNHDCENQDHHFFISYSLATICSAGRLNPIWGVGRFGIRVRVLILTGNRVSQCKHISVNSNIK